MIILEAASFKATPKNCELFVKFKVSEIPQNPQEPKEIL